MCNAPRFGKVEPRTGYGGGYMERDENPEYVRREDDSEYDDVSLWVVFVIWIRPKICDNGQIMK
jgi:hypothetical protein